MVGSYTEVLDADDTLIFGNYTHHINLLLKEIQLESKYYGTELRQMREPNPQPKTIIHQIPRWHAARPSKKVSCFFLDHCSQTP